MKQSILNLKENCWRIKEVDHLAILFDGNDYYQAFFDVAKQAKHSILISGWEVDARMGLGRVGKGYPDNLRDYFNDLAKKRESLKIWILSWKPAFFLAFGRERFAKSRWNFKTLSRITYSNDKLPYLFSSFHEKMILIDNCCAFLGGMDLTKKRWDTSDHDPVSNLRIDGLGKTYQPVHDIQFVMTGEIIASLRELVERRIKSSSGLKEERLSDIWPTTHSPQMRKTSLAISRTDPFENVYEIEKLYKDAIRSAEKLVFIENQYLTHQEIMDILSERLSDPNGPEVIIILPFSYQGTFERAIYVNGRNKIIKKLKVHDKFNRLGVYYPGIPNKNPLHFIKVHSKLMIVDDTFLTLGSANLNYRSMLVDSEINLSLESKEELESREFITQNVIHLLAEHLHIDSSELRKEYERTGKFITVINEFKGKQVKTLKELPLKELTFIERLACLITPFVDIKYAVPKWLLLLPLIPLMFWALYEYSKV